MAEYLVKTGLDLPTGKRYEAGEIATDIPPSEIKWLREQGHIELVTPDEPAQPAKASSAKKAKGGE